MLTVEITTTSATPFAATRHFTSPAYLCTRYALCAHRTASPHYLPLFISCISSAMSIKIHSPGQTSAARKTLCRSRGAT